MAESKMGWRSQHYDLIQKSNKNILILLKLFVIFCITNGIGIVKSQFVKWIFLVLGEKSKIPVLGFIVSPEQESTPLNNNDSGWV
ncbi:hypothetical protein L0337_27300 [candidate division KSB1 bacterium]|nr:hypothetical protein [candidate division KSB1 bacterium]